MGRKGRNEGCVCGFLCIVKGYCFVVSGLMYIYVFYLVFGDDEGIVVVMVGVNRGGFKEVC